MMSPGGFDATIEKWRTQGVYTRLKLLDHLPRQYTCIVYDRRESGESGGRVEHITWAHYVAQAKGSARSPADSSRAHHGRVHGLLAGDGVRRRASGRDASLVLYWPVGGAHYRINGHARVAEHLAYVEQHGLHGVVSLVTAERQDLQPGSARRLLGLGHPARSGLRHRVHALTTSGRTRQLVIATRDTLFDRDTSPGAEPEDLFRLDIPALVVPGRDKSHATSAARYLEECLPRAEYWDVAVDDQTEETVPPRCSSS